MLGGVTEQVQISHNIANGAVVTDKIRGLMQLNNVLKAIHTTVITLRLMKFYEEQDIPSVAFKEITRCV